MLIPMVGIVVLVYKEQGKTSLFLMLSNIGCLLMNCGYYLLLRTRSIDVAGLAYSIEYLGNIIFYLFFMLFVLSYLHVRYPKWMTYLCGVFEFFDMVLLLGFPNSGLIFKKLEFVVHRELGVQTVDLVPGSVYMVRYSLICLFLLVGVAYMSFKCLVVESREERNNLARLAGSGFVVMLSLVLMLQFGFEYDIVPISASLSIIAIILSVIHGEMFRVTDSGREWVFEHIDNAFVIVDSAYGYLESNARAREVFPDLVHKRKNQRISDELYGIMVGDKDEEEINERFYEKKVVALEDEKGRVQGYSLVLIDDTEHYRLMEELMEAKQRAEDANKAKSNFMSNMSHEIRTPMNAIVGMTEILMRSDLPPKEREYLSNIQNSGNALLKIINDILDFSKIESGKLEVIEDSYEPMSMLSDLGMIFLNRIGNKDVELLFDIDSRMPHRLYGDELRIRQVIINLMNNAIKFTDEGSVKLAIQVTEPEGDGETEGTGDGSMEKSVALAISVKDTGQGIAQDDLNKLFASFQQVDTKRNRYKEGTGLGLAISQQLIGLMGGEIKVRSEYGKGSEFYFTIRQGVVDAAMAAAIKPENQGHAVMFRFGSGLVGENAQKLAADYHVRVIGDTVISREAVPDDLGYVFSDNPGLFTEEEKNAMAARGISFCVLRNPMLDSVWNTDETSLNKPLYSLNFCQAINHETESAVAQGEENLSFTAPNAQVLVVDDNEMNLKVARGLLEPLHLNIDTAANGKQAVGMVQNRHYDIVFMDHMMPVMDGIEATREIRKLEGDYYQSLPIIALSANATTEAREMFTKEGLDDFVAKPIQMKDICRCILRWLPRELVEMQETSALDGGAGEGLTEDVEAIGDLDVAEGIRNCGTKKLFTSLLGDFYKLIDSKSTKLDKCLEDGMVRDYTIEVHALKNTARMIGATELSDMFYRMEQLGNEQNVDEIRRLHPALMERYRGYKPVLREYASSDNEDKENVSSEVIKDTLMKLHDAMDSFDLDGADEAMKLLETYAFPEDMQDKVTELSAYVADVAMEDVMRLTEELAREM